MRLVIGSERACWTTCSLKAASYALRVRRSGALGAPAASATCASRPTHKEGILIFSPRRKNLRNEPLSAVVFPRWVSENSGTRILAIGRLPFPVECPIRPIVGGQP